MQMDRTQGCCGLGEIYELSLDRNGEPVDKLDPDFLAEIEQESYDENHGYMLTTINDEQEEKGFGKVLLAAHWTRVRRFHNPNSGNMVSIYMKRHRNLHRNDDQREE